MGQVGRTVFIKSGTGSISEFDRREKNPGTHSKYFENRETVEKLGGAIDNG